MLCAKHKSNQILTQNWKETNKHITSIILRSIVLSFGTKAPKTTHTAHTFHLRTSPLCKISASKFTMNKTHHPNIFEKRIYLVQYDTTTKQQTKHERPNSAKIQSFGRLKKSSSSPRSAITPYFCRRKNQSKVVSKVLKTTTLLKRREKLGC